MKSAELDVEVTSLKEKTTSMLARLDTMLISTRQEIARDVAQWMLGEVNRRVTDHPEKIQALGIEKLKQLKAKVNALAEQAPAIVDSLTSNRVAWPHHTTPDETSSRSTRDEPFLNKVFREAISYLGPVLDEFGLLSDKKGYVAS